MKKGRNIRLGLFIVTATVLFMVGMYLIGDKQNLFSSTIEIHAIFKNVNGLQTGNNVRFSGINVGTIDDVEILDNASVLVTMIIQKDVQQFIKKDALVSIGTDGLMGNKLINIDHGSPLASSVDENDTLGVKHVVDLDLAYENLESTNANINTITHDIIDIIRQIGDGTGTIGNLISDSILSQNIQETVVNLRLASVRAEHLLNFVEQGIEQTNFQGGTVGTLLSDTILAQDIKTVISDLSRTTENTKTVSEDLKKLITEIRQGDGMAGSIIVDTVLSLKLEESLENVRKGTAAFNENMEALKHNFFFRSYFKNQEKEKKKEEKDKKK